MSCWLYLRCEQGDLYLLLYNFFIKITPIYIIQYNKKFSLEYLDIEKWSLETLIHVEILVIYV